MDRRKVITSVIFGVKMRMHCGFERIAQGEEDQVQNQEYQACQQKALAVGSDAAILLSRTVARARHRQLNRPRYLPFPQSVVCHCLPPQLFTIVNSTDSTDIIISFGPISSIRCDGTVPNQC